MEILIMEMGETPSVKLKVDGSVFLGIQVIVTRIIDLGL